MLGDLGGWREGLSRAGIELAHSERSGANLVVAPASLTGDALRTEADMVILEGRCSRAALRSAGYAVRRFAPLPRIDAPTLMLPLDQPAPARYAIRRWVVPTRRWKRVRNRAVEGLLARGWFPSRAWVTVAARSPGPPRIVSAATGLGAPQNAQWFLTLGGTHPLARCAFHLFAPGGREPAFALKFGRIAEARFRFDREAAAFERAVAAGGVVGSHAPRLLGRLEVEGLPVSLETAAVGERLATLLTSPGGRRKKLAAIEDVAAWLVDLGAQTCSPARRAEEELAYLAESVVPRWEAYGASAEVVDRAASAPAVLKHGDLDPQNIIFGPGGFTVVDWEDADPQGLPLGDLVSFLAEVLAQLDGAVAREARERHFAALFRGELRSSSTLFRWTRAGVEASHTPPQSVGSIVTLLWLALAFAARRFGDSADRLANSPPAGELLFERLARLWLSDPALGPGWDRWRASS